MRNFIICLFCLISVVSTAFGQSTIATPISDPDYYELKARKDAAIDEIAKLKSETPSSDADAVILLAIIYELRSYAGISVNVPEETTNKIDKKPDAGTKEIRKDTIKASLVKLKDARAKATNDPEIILLDLQIRALNRIVGCGNTPSIGGGGGSNQSQTPKAKPTPSPTPAENWKEKYDRLTEISGELVSSLTTSNNALKSVIAENDSLRINNEYYASGITAKPLSYEDAARFQTFANQHLPGADPSMTPEKALRRAFSDIGENPPGLNSKHFLELTQNPQLADAFLYRLYTGEEIPKVSLEQVRRMGVAGLFEQRDPNLKAKDKAEKRMRRSHTN